MKRMLIIGPGGAGKTTLALAVAQATGIPVVHLDQLYWRAGWQARPAAEWSAIVAALVRQPEWIMDGNYGGTLAPRLQAADSVVFLDLPPLLCMRRVIGRWLRYRGTARESMPAGCPERITPAFLWWIWTYRTRRRGQILEALRRLEATQAVHILRSPAEVAAFLHELPATLASRANRAGT